MGQKTGFLPCNEILLALQGTSLCRPTDHPLQSKETSVAKRQEFFGVFGRFIFSRLKKSNVAKIRTFLPVTAILQHDFRAFFYLKNTCFLKDVNNIYLFMAYDNI